MKKIAALSVCMVMAASLFSCGDKDNKKSKSSPGKVANDYMDACYRKKGGEKVLSLIYPDEYIKKLKDDGDWKDEIAEYNDEIRDCLEDYKIKIDSVKRGNEIKDLEGAESYFESRYKIKSADVSKGYEYKAKIKITEHDNEDTRTISDKFCVVKLDGDWKIIPTSADFFENYAD